MTMKRIEPKDFCNYGISITGDEMDNGEIRFRMMSEASSYIRVDSCNADNWQNAHYHSEQKEFFFIEKGAAIVVTLEDQKKVINHYSSGEFFVVAPMIPHNVFMEKGSISHTIKWGGTPDWVPFPELDFPTVD